MNITQSSPDLLALSDANADTYAALSEIGVRFKHAIKTGDVTDSLRAEWREAQRAHMRARTAYDLQLAVEIEAARHSVQSEVLAKELAALLTDEGHTDKRPGA